MSNKCLLLDACVLIDYFKADRRVLKLIARHVGSLIIITPVLEEISEIKDENDLVKFDIKLVEPEIEDAFIAANTDFCPAISFTDSVCLLTAKRHGYILVTNDKKLQETCRENGVSVIRGLKLLLELHNAGGISKNDAEIIALSIHKLNPRYITPDIIKRFKNIILRQETNQRKKRDQ